MPDQFVTIETVSGRHEAEFLKAYLVAQGVKCELSQEAGGAFGFSIGSLGRVEIRVPSKDVTRARKIVQDYQKNN